MYQVVYDLQITLNCALRRPLIVEGFHPVLGVKESLCTIFFGTPCTLTITFSILQHDKNLFYRSHFFFFTKAFSSFWLENDPAQHPAGNNSNHDFAIFVLANNDLA